MNLKKYDIQDEKVALNKEIAKIETFMETTDFTFMNLTDKTLIEAQLSSMKAYQSILVLREERADSEDSWGNDSWDD